MQLRTGRIRKLLDGCGFIAADGGPDSFFFRRSDVVGPTPFYELVEGYRVRFVPHRGPRGWVAINVTWLDATALEQSHRGPQDRPAGEESHGPR